MNERLVQWQPLEFRVSGKKIEELARSVMATQQAPVDDLRMQFGDGELRVSGRVKRGLPVPFRAVIRKIVPSARAVVIPIQEMSAFGLPLPAILGKLAGNRQAAAGILFDAESNSIVIQLDRFLPSFLDVDISDISIIDGGLLVKLRSGGADLPSPGGLPWSAPKT